ncbi:hypothetical protein [Chryseobacterium gambrini]|uniref:hypothetical protein n=1 Tax=Chryseobacterium gambrini TaxID=373672 RepID=UPI001E5F8A36|nr:hypothetical protein [Chryseobacterium gambrini]
MCPLFAPFPVYALPIPEIMVWSAALKVSCAEGVPKVPPPDPVAAAAVTLISTPGITAFSFTETLRVGSATDFIEE